MQPILFYTFAILAVASAVAMVLHRNPVYSAIFLILTLFSLAGFFVLLNAPFVAAVHIIVYAGAIMVLFLFVIMLLNLKRDPVREAGKIRRRFLGAALVLTLLLEVSALIGATYFLSGTGAGGRDAHVGLQSNVSGSTADIGRALFTTYLLPFEVASVLLLVAMVGAVVLAKRKLH
ncbi:MAG: NADH-quinone oxidoreductase subunit J [candidate division KSB1 bacterium]|nr:NADH-quinone oxidoreductase subunit J [candidate division KSB1 bacterium]MDZ7276424.1 NADH-quinone oxidoreductase subunit J [candidate division KSB1 bacterium]MDZ7288094.1 NADH-quinone oxidoreductase subunit J [candidate division KSB1 bacterium]MDZ7300195.1 NADH-quinone oxidoreductase subunit J [candidate division KSB1 bacterium]MDZ7305766.1 NADH-quinone oxidoreductase subunit J [candidate division KSB1 bacterium]